MEKWIDVCQRRPWWILGVVALVSAVCLWGASHLRFDGDLARLLPQDAPSVRGLKSLETTYGAQIGRVALVLSGASVEQNRALAESLEAPLAKVKGVERVEIVDPVSQLRKDRLMYMSLEDANVVSERLQARIKWERKQANPLFVSLSSKGPPSVDMADIEAKYKGNDRTFYEGKNGEVLVFVHPNFPASNLNKSKDIVAAVDETAKRVVAEQKWPGTISMAGRYPKRVEQQELMTADMSRATGIALMCLLVFLFIYFGRIGAVLRVLAPLALGTLVSLSAAYWIFGALNILTGFLGAILLGLGVDYGIHLVSKLSGLRETMGPREALVSTFMSTGRANVYAGVTTMVALGSLMLSKFRAFFEFGVIAVIGVLSILLAYTILLPTWEALRPNVKPSRVLSVRLGKLLGEKIERSKTFTTSLIVACFVLCLGSLGLSLGASRLYLDQSFDSLVIRDAPSQRVDKDVTGILGRSQTPAVILAQDGAHAALVQAEVLRRQEHDPRGYTIKPLLEGGRSVLSARDLVPTQQSEKLKLWNALALSIDRVPERARSEELQSFDSDLRHTLKRGILSLKSIPVNLSAPLRRRDRDDSSVVLVFPSVDLSDAKPLIDFSMLLRDLPGPTEQSPRIQAVSDSQLLVEILDLVRRDLKWMVGATLGGIFLMTLLAFGFRRWSAVLLIALGLAISAGLGALGWMGQPVNFINALVFPVWFGLAVDASFHLLMHQREHPGDVPGWCSTMLSVAAAFITSMIGFGALIFSRHQGLASLSTVALVGLGTILAIELAVAGLFLWWSSRARSTSQESSNV